MSLQQICKKQKAVAEPVQVQHYKDGEFSAVYDRKFSVKVCKFKQARMATAPFLNNVAK